MKVKRIKLGKAHTGLKHHAVIRLLRRNQPLGMTAGQGMDAAQLSDTTVEYLTIHDSFKGGETVLTADRQSAKMLTQRVLQCRVASQIPEIKGQGQGDGSHGCEDIVHDIFTYFLHREPLALLARSLEKLS